MCGIIGYKGNKDATSIVIEGLKNLEYRGYDSWGIAFKAKDISNIETKRYVGRIGEFKETLRKSNLAIGHTRWATHGSVTEKNAHPHMCCRGEIAVVHNGIIENFQELKKELNEEGHLFASETDTEVIPHLIESYMEYGFENAVKKALKRLNGSYAIVAINNKTDEMIGARNGSPLVFGVDNGSYFIASDIPAFLSHTSNVVYLEDYDIITVNHDYRIFNAKEDSGAKRELSKISWTHQQAQKGDFPHFMLKEISEQPAAIARAVSQEREKIEKIAGEINKAKGIFFIACGTAYHAALISSYIFSKIAKKHVNVVLASEFPNYSQFLSKDTLLIPVSQSGETADVLGAVKEAKSKGAKIISIVNVMGSSLVRASDDCLLLNSGPEICVLATKSYTAQIALLTLVAYASAHRYEDGKRVLEETSSGIKQILDDKNLKKIDGLAAKIHKSEHLFTIGRGTNFATALEAALKIKEVSYIHAEGFAGGELKHGTIALIEKGTPCIVFSDTETEREIIGNAMEIKARGGYIIGISPNPNEVFDYWIEMPSSGLGAISFIVPAQLLAYRLALLRNCDPDKPRNLAKSVTVK